MKQFSQSIRSSVIALAIAATLPISTAVLAIDLAEVYQLARDNDASFAANLQAYEVAKLNQPLAEAAMNSFVTGSGGLDRKYSKFTPNGGKGSGSTANTINLAVNLQKKLYDVKEQLSVNQAQIGVEIARLNLEQQAQALVLKVAQRYFDVLAAEDKKSLAQKEQAAIGRQLDLAEQRLEVGLGTKTDLYDANARFLLAEASLIGAENAIVDSLQSLSELVGQPLGSDLAKLKDDGIEKISENILSTKIAWVDRAKGASIAIRIAQENLASSRIDVEKAAKLNNPVVSLSAGAGYADLGASSSSPSGDNQSLSVGINVNVPLYQGGTIKTQQLQAGYKQTQAELNLKQAEREVTTAVSSAYRGVDSSRRQVEALSEAVKASESALEAKEEGFKAGVTTNLDVLDGQRDLFSARSNYLSARYNALLALLRLNQAAGTLDAEDIRIVNQRLE